MYLLPYTPMERWTASVVGWLLSLSPFVLLALVIISEAY